MTLVARPTPPTVVRPELAVPKTVGQSCFCEDKDLARMQGLMARGMDQRAASRAVWGDPAAPTPHMAVVHPGRWARALVRHTLSTRLPWLRLPTPTEVS